MVQISFIFGELSHFSDFFGSFPYKSNVDQMPRVCVTRGWSLSVSGSWQNHWSNQKYHWHYNFLEIGIDHDDTEEDDTDNDLMNRYVTSSYNTGTTGSEWILEEEVVEDAL